MRQRGSCRTVDPSLSVRSTFETVCRNGMQTVDEERELVPFRRKVCLCASKQCPTTTLGKYLRYQDESWYTIQHRLQHSPPQGDPHRVASRLKLLQCSPGFSRSMWIGLRNPYLLKCCRCFVDISEALLLRRGSSRPRAWMTTIPTGRIAEEMQVCCYKRAVPTLAYIFSLGH